MDSFFFSRSERTYFRALIVCLWSHVPSPMMALTRQLILAFILSKIATRTCFRLRHWSLVMFLWNHLNTNIFNFEKCYLKYYEHSSVHSQFYCPHFDNRSTGRNILISFLLSTAATENYNGRLLLQMIVCTVDTADSSKTCNNF